MNNLFAKTSKVLRDCYIIELQKSNDFLRNKLSNINVNPFFGYKVNIKEHAYAMGTEFFPKTPGIVYNINKSYCWVLYKNEDNEKTIRSFVITNIEFVDPRFDDLLK